MREEFHGPLDFFGVVRGIRSCPALSSTAFLRISARTDTKRQEVSDADSRHLKRNEREGAQKLPEEIFVPLSLKQPRRKASPIFKPHLLSPGAGVRRVHSRRGPLRPDGKLVVSNYRPHTVKKARSYVGPRRPLLVNAAAAASLTANGIGFLHLKTERSLRTAAIMAKSS